MTNPPGATWRERLLWLFGRVPDCCAIETGRDGIVTWYDEAAERFFGFSAAEVRGRMRYEQFHDAEQMKACRSDPEFMATIAQHGWIESTWRVIPKSGEAFDATVTLVRRPPEKPGAREEGWIALYRRS